MEGPVLVCLFGILFIPYILSIHFRNRTAPRIITAVNVPDATSLSTIRHRTGQQIRHLFLGQQLHPCRLARSIFAIALHFCSSPKSVHFLRFALFSLAFTEKLRRA